MSSKQDEILAEIYSTLNELVESYTTVMSTFSSVVTDVVELRAEITELKKYSQELYADAVTAAGIWKAAAEAHKAEAATLKTQLEAMEKNRA